MSCLRTSRPISYDDYDVGERNLTLASLHINYRKKALKDQTILFQIVSYLIILYKMILLIKDNAYAQLKKIKHSYRIALRIS